jgi:hypothetical protein
MNRLQDCDAIAGHRFVFVPTAQNAKYVKYWPATTIKSAIETTVGYFNRENHDIKTATLVTTSIR